MTVAIPINPNASPNTKRVLQLLYNMMDDNKFLSAQHNWIETPNGDSNWVQAEQGVFPAIQGFEMGPIANQSNEVIATQRQGVIDAAKQHWYRDGIVTMCWHQNYPLTSYQWANVQRTSTTDAEFDQILTPGDPKHTWLLEEFGKVAGFLQQLDALGIPVIWRPYHEMNGYWFWWGKKQRFNDLWALMYDRFTNYHGLNNLLWCWTPNAPKNDPNQAALDAHYPGPSNVDILGLDLYVHLDAVYSQSSHDSLAALAPGKPLCIGECGKLPHAASTIKAGQNKYVYAMPWGGEYIRTYNTVGDRDQFYDHVDCYSTGDFTLPLWEGEDPEDPPVDPEDPPVDPEDPEDPPTEPEEPPVAIGDPIGVITDKLFIPPQLSDLTQAPKFIGQSAVDEEGAYYYAKGLSSADDWVKLPSAMPHTPGTLAPYYFLSQQSGYKFTFVINDDGSGLQAIRIE